MTYDEQENAVRILANEIGLDKLIEIAGYLSRGASTSTKFKEVSAELDAAIDTELSEHPSIMTDETDTQAAMGHKAHK